MITPNETPTPRTTEILEMLGTTEQGNAIRQMEIELIARIAEVESWKLQWGEESMDRDRAVVMAAELEKENAKLKSELAATHAAAAEMKQFIRDLSGAIHGQGCAR